MGGKHTGANYDLAKAEVTRLMHRLLKHLRPGTVFVSKQVRVLAKLTL